MFKVFFLTRASLERADTLSTHAFKVLPETLAFSERLRFDTRVSDFKHAFLPI